MLGLMLISVCTRCSVVMQSEKGTKRSATDKIACRGQGRCYAKKPIGKPTYDNHFNFSGAFEGLCCYCAFHSGWCLSSLREVGCLLCKVEISRYVTFMTEIENSRKFWALLPHGVIVHILKFVVRGDRTTPETTVLTTKPLRTKVQRKKARRV